QAGEIIDEVFAEPPGARQPIKLFGSKAQLGEKLEHLFEPGRNQKAALARKLAHEEFEARGLGLTAIEIGLHHVELVEIGQQCACRRVHAATFAHDACRASKARPIAIALESERGSYFNLRTGALGRVCVRPPLIPAGGAKCRSGRRFRHAARRPPAVAPKSLSAGAESLSLIANPVAKAGRRPSRRRDASKSTEN